MAARDRYFPVESGDGSDSRLLEENPHSSPEEVPRERSRSSSPSNGYKPQHFISVWTFSLIVLGVAVMFLLGVCVGFYVRELQKGDPDINKLCGPKQKPEVNYDLLGSYHETLIYYIRGVKIKNFVNDFGSDDPVTGSDLEQKLATVVLQEFESSRFDGVETEEYDIVVTSSDPDRPNQLVVLHHNGTKLHDMVLTNEKGSAVSNSSLPGDTSSLEWRHPHVAFSPPGQAEAKVVYGHYGGETDFMVLDGLGVDVKDKIVLLRLGKLSVAEKIMNCQAHGAQAVLLYWEPQDAVEDVNAPVNTSYIPYVSATTYSADLPTFWHPSIPCQTISSDQAAVLISQMAQGVNTTSAPDPWQGSLAETYVIGSRKSDGIRVRVSVFNIPRKRHIVNIIATIDGTEEPDRYVIVGAPRASLPGQSQDAIASTSILTQLAHSFHYVHNRHYWKPRRGVKLISWGGAEFSNSGMLQYIQARHHVLASRAVAMFDLSQLAVGNDSVVASIPPGLHQLLKEATYDVPDPKDPEETLHMSWTAASQQNDTAGQKLIPLSSYHRDRTQNPFLHVIGVPVVRLQYTAPPGSQKSVLAMTSEDLNHHYKYHIAVTRILTLTLLSLLDNHVLPFTMTDTLRSLELTLWQTSGVLEECSDDMENLYPAMSVCKDLSRGAKALGDMTNLYVKRSDRQGVRTTNDIKMLFHRLFVIPYRGHYRHILYPTLDDGSIALATELCTVGTVTEVWNVTAEFGQILTNTLKEALFALQFTG